MLIDFGDTRLRCLVESQEEWSEEALQRRIGESVERLRDALSAAESRKIWLAVGGVGLRQELTLFHSVYRRPDTGLTRRTLSVLCHAFHLARKGLFLTTPDLNAVQGRMDVLCEHGVLASWLGHHAALGLVCEEMARAVPAEREQLGSLDTAHLNFCVEICNAQALAPKVSILPDPDHDTMYLALPFPTSAGSVSLKAIQSVLDQRIQRSYEMEEKGRGAYFYHGPHRSVFPFEVLAYYRLFKLRGQLQSDEALHPMIEYFDQFSYDSCVESEPVFVEVENFIERHRVR